MTAYLGRARAAARLQRGDVLHMQLRDGARQWWFEAPFAAVSDVVVSSLLFGANPAVRVMEAGDSLFGLPMNSQTWLATHGGEQ